jgi:hypothetical protein
MCWQAVLNDVVPLIILHFKGFLHNRNLMSLGGEFTEPELYSSICFLHFEDRLDHKTIKPRKNGFGGFLKISYFPQTFKEIKHTVFPLPITPFYMKLCRN